MIPKALKNLIEAYKRANITAYEHGDAAQRAQIIGNALINYGLEDEVPQFWSPEVDDLLSKNYTLMTDPEVVELLEDTELLTNKSSMSEQVALVLEKYGESRVEKYLSLQQFVSDYLALLWTDENISELRVIFDEFMNNNPAFASSLGADLELDVDVSVWDNLDLQGDLPDIDPEHYEQLFNNFLFTYAKAALYRFLLPRNLELATHSNRILSKDLLSDRYRAKEGGPTQLVQDTQSWIDRARTYHQRSKHYTTIEEFALLDNLQSKSFEQAMLDLEASFNRYGKGSPERDLIHVTMAEYQLLKQEMLDQQAQLLRGEVSLDDFRIQSRQTRQHYSQNLIELRSRLDSSRSMAPELKQQVRSILTSTIDVIKPQKPLWQQSLSLWSLRKNIQGIVDQNHLQVKKAEHGSQQALQLRAFGHVVQRVEDKLQNLIDQYRLHLVTQNEVKEVLRDFIRLEVAQLKSDVDLDKVTLQQCDKLVSSVGTQRKTTSFLPKFSLFPPQSGRTVAKKSSIVATHTTALKG